MKVVFLSNYYNHHQSALAEAMYRLTDGQYAFIQTEKMGEERRKLGWKDAVLPSYVHESYLSEESYAECLRLIDEADVVITGSAPEKMLHHRIRAGKLVFRYSERIYKSRKKLWQIPLRALKYHGNDGLKGNVHLLCASAYAAADYGKSGNYRGKAYRWGYFPAVKTYDDLNSLLDQKKPASILWAGRMLDWKHPELVVNVARRLKEDGCSFEVNIIGNGALEETLKQQIQTYQLQDCVHMLGGMGPEQVRSHMEQSSIYLFTSDFNEGWGVVLNESMNSACAVVASHGIGSAPFLVRDGENGLLFESENENDLYNKVRFLLDNPEKQRQLGREAYKTVTAEWAAESAAERFIDLAQHILRGEDSKALYAAGPCSAAPRLPNDWYKA